MGIILGMLLGPLVVASMIGIVTKLTLDAISYQFHKQPFRYLSWWLVILFAVIVGGLGYHSVSMDIATHSRTDFLGISPELMGNLTLISLFTLPSLAFYAIVRSIFKQKNPPLALLAGTLIDISGEDKIKRKWQRFWLIVVSVYPMFLFLMFLLNSVVSFIFGKLLIDVGVGGLDGFLVSILFALMAYPLILLGAWIHSRIVRLHP